MKTKQEIEQLAENNYPLELWSEEESLIQILAFKKGYTQCQENMADKKYTEEDVQNVLDGFTNEAPGEYIKTNFIELLNKQK
jgi:hypothetical protein